jgi:hypothetical protein
MRAFWIACTLFASLAAADDFGVPPRRLPADYPVHAGVQTATLAAVVVPSDQVKKMFSGEISKKYFVIEVAVYPEAGQSFDVDEMSFVLRTGDQVLQTSDPGDVAGLWPGNNNPVGHRGPNITTETGVIVGRETDPITGRPRTSVGTYEGVAVSNYPQPNIPSPPPKNAGVTEAKLRQMALPQGPTRIPVAGYLYFRPNGKKHDPLTLNYSKDDLSVDLKFR